MRLLSRVKEVVDPEGTRMIWQIRGWLGDYLGKNPPSDQAEWKGLLLIGDPFRREGKTYIYLQSFVRYIRISMEERKVTSAEICENLRALGFKIERLGVKVGDKLSTRACWSIGTNDLATQLELVAHIPIREASKKNGGSV